MEIRFTKKAQKELYSLDKKVQKNIKKAIYEKLLLEPKKYLISLN